jgi:hypothetical protein
MDPEERICCPAARTLSLLIPLEFHARLRRSVFFGEPNNPENESGGAYAYVLALTWELGARLLPAWDFKRY